MKGLFPSVRENRDIEWLFGGLTTFFGLWIWLPPRTFTPLFSYIERWNDEPFWGVLLLLCGIGHLTALFVNGAHPVTPRVRLVSVMAAMLTYGALGVGIFMVNPHSLAMALMVAMASLSFHCIYRAEADHAAAKARRDGKDSP